MDKNEIEIPFGSKDSELVEAIYHIPDGMEAIIEGDKVVIRKKKSNDEKIKQVINAQIRMLNGVHSLEEDKPFWKGTYNELRWFARYFYKLGLEESEL